MSKKMADLQQHKTSAKYLTHYAEPEVLSLATFPEKSVYQHVIVIPAFQESTQFIERFIDSVLVEQQCLINKHISTYRCVYMSFCLNRCKARQIGNIKNNVYHCIYKN